MIRNGGCMTDLEIWLKEILKQRDSKDTEWFLNRPSLKAAKGHENN
jgi:hypothetical protein